MERCENCGGRFDRAGLGAPLDLCEGDGEQQHVAPSIADLIMRVVEDELNDRGMNLMDSLDYDTEDQVRDAVTARITAVLEPHA